MDDFDFIRPLSTHSRFTVFEAYAKKLGFQVVLKQCAFTTLAEVEFFVRSALIKARDGVYSQPLLLIFASPGRKLKQSFINFVWKRGKVQDLEVVNDRKSQFPSGRNGLEKRETVHTNIGVSAKRVHCLTIGKDVICRVFKAEQVLEMNDAFREALAQARCKHPNICDYLDFRMYKGKKSRCCAYIVMECLEQDLATEVWKREPDRQLYDEMELMNILRDVTAGLLYAKSQGLAHGDIKPSNILRGPQGLKLAGATWPKGQLSTTSPEQCISPETWEAVETQRPFESDVFSLGVTMLDLAAAEVPERTPGMSRSELQALLQRKVQALTYSEELKRLLTAMLSTAPSDRPPLETVQVDADRIYQQAAQGLAQEALGLRQQASSSIDKGEYVKAIELATAAHAIYSRFPEDKDTAINLNNWGLALYCMGRNEALEKYAAAHAIYSRLPEDKDTADNLQYWGFVLRDMGRSEEAAEKYAAAHAIYSRLSEDKDTTDNLQSWGYALSNMGRSEEAAEKYAVAHAIYSRLPEDKNTAYDLYTWAMQFYKVGRIEEAVEKYAAAHAIYSRLPEDKEAAINLREWGLALRKMGRNAEALEKYSAAHAICSRLPGDKDTAISLREWGLALRKMGKEAEAVEKHAEAYAICFRLPEDIDAATNLEEWGLVLIMVGRKAEAMEKFEVARAIYVLLQHSTYAGECDTVIAQLL